MARDNFNEHHRPRVRLFINPSSPEAKGRWSSEHSRNLKHQHQFVVEMYCRETGIPNDKLRILLGLQRGVNATGHYTTTPLTNNLTHKMPIFLQTRVEDEARLMSSAL